jgi:allantoate deiminase
MRAAGLSVSEDALGTLRGSYGRAKRRLLIGSHIDTVIDAGMYDGPFGVISGILAAEYFSRKPLRFGIDVARRGWLEKGDVFNTRTLADVRQLA